MYFNDYDIGSICYYLTAKYMIAKLLKRTLQLKIVPKNNKNTKNIQIIYHNIIT